jgi:drug/metabolite transporter (DMT)-like permease
MIKYIAVVLCVIFNVLAQAWLKHGALAEAKLNLFGFINFNLLTLAGLFSYGISFILTIYIYKHFTLSTISPIMIALTISLIIPVDKIFFDAIISPVKIVGIAVLTLGVFIISRSS